MALSGQTTSELERELVFASTERAYAAAPTNLDGISRFATGSREEEALESNRARSQWRDEQGVVTL